jgi:hypothetical protein
VPLRARLTQLDCDALDRMRVAHIKFVDRWKWRRAFRRRYRSANLMLDQMRVQCQIQFWRRTDSQVTIKTKLGGRAAASKAIGASTCACAPFGNVTQSVMPKIFISYRRQDSPYEAVALRDRLASHFGKEHVFFDLNAIRLGHNFRVEIGEKVGGCDYLLALIGKSWLTVCDENGRRRLDDPDDWVCLEIEAALKRGIPVIAVLFHNVRMPKRQQLPDSIRELADRQSLSVRPLADLNHDVDKLISDIEEQEADRSKRARNTRKGIAAANVLALGRANESTVATNFAVKGETASTESITFNPDLAERLPSLLAQLYADAVYAKSALERHQSAFYVWEATIKLMGGAAIVAWAARGEPDEQIAQSLKTLARPALGHWLGYC